MIGLAQFCKVVRPPGCGAKVWPVSVSSKRVCRATQWLLPLLFCLVSWHPVRAGEEQSTTQLPPVEAASTNQKQARPVRSPLEGQAAKLAGVWWINVPTLPGIHLLLQIRPDGTYSTHAQSINNPAIETGTIQARSGAYVLTALTGEQEGKRDEGSFQLQGTTSVYIRGLYGRGTWTRLEEGQSPGNERGITTGKSRPSQSTSSSPFSKAGRLPFLNEVEGTARSSGRYSGDFEVEGTAVAFGRNEPPGGTTSGFVLPNKSSLWDNNNASISIAPIATTGSSSPDMASTGPPGSTTATASPERPAMPSRVNLSAETLGSRQSASNHPADAQTQSGSAQKTAATAVDQNPPTTLKDRPVKDKWALVVGISKFQKPELNLTCPATDAADFARFLVNQCHFAQDHVRVLTDEQATRSRILNELGDKWLPHVVRPDDLVLVYLSTHGSPADIDVGGVNYLLAWDTDPESLYSTGMPMQDLMRIIKGRLRSDRVMMVLDACYSGNVSPQSKGIHRGSNVDVEEIVQGTGQLVISSSQSNQVSWESKTGKNSVFTKHLMAALRLKGDKTKLGEAFNALRNRVEDEVQRERGRVQIPIMKSQWEGTDLMLSVPPAEPRPGL